MEHSHSALRHARIIVAAATAPRFRGRAALVRLAQLGDETALVALEADARGRELAALRGTLSLSVIAALALDSVRDARELRERRASARTAGRDPLAARQPGNVQRRATMRAFRAAFELAQFRTAKHVHESSVEYTAGAPSASSSSSSIWASDAGLSKAYCRRAYRVATSDHAWHVSPAILRVPAGERAALGVLYLAPDVRVRQGRGTSLVCERRVGRRWVA